MVTQRDARVINFLDEFKIASTETINTLFYGNPNVARRRLTAIVESGCISRSRDGFGSSYVYYIKKPKQVQHSLVLTNFYRKASEVVSVKKFLKEPKLGGVIPDGVIGYTSNGVNRLACVEVELSNKGFDAEKYNTFDWKPYFPVEPELIIITDKKLPSVKLKTITIDTELKTINLIV